MSDDGQGPGGRRNERHHWGPEAGHCLIGQILEQRSASAAFFGEGLGGLGGDGYVGPGVQTDLMAGGSNILHFLGKGLNGMAGDKPAGRNCRKITINAKIKTLAILVVAKKSTNEANEEGISGHTTSFYDPYQPPVLLQLKGYQVLCQPLSF